MGHRDQSNPGSARNTPRAPAAPRPHPGPPAPPEPESLAPAVERWFAAAARDLPWRTHPRDPYRSLVSELMLQQTQVARVIDRFDAFVARFPTARALAAADEQEVLAEWSGLGYYRRARLLHACARAIVADHAGRVPTTAAELRSLPGIGAYTAGALASIVFGKPEPAVDGNVIRVLLRLHGSELAQDAPATRTWATDHARALAEAADDPGAVAEGLMELGATVCTPGAPKCDACPLRASCVARREGTTTTIPAPKTRAKVSALFCDSILDEDTRGRLLVERRPTAGMWGGLWQAPTLEQPDRAPTAADVRAFARARSVERVESFEHKTSHRLVRFRVWHATGARAGSLRVRRSRAQIAELGLSNPQRRILLGP
ncbi:MAG: A/G-specific adenine glycosylase [Phycisphaeraceae bacterium]|nr:MAG: A/G-specific adenine glycosylase [Phycisphaeraceae bacterium]